MEMLPKAGPFAVHRLPPGGTACVVARRSWLRFGIDHRQLHAVSLKGLIA